MVKQRSKRYSSTAHELSNGRWRGSVRKTPVLSLLLTTIYCLTLLPFNERIAFVNPVHGNPLLVSYGLKLLFFIALYSLLYFIIHFYKQIRSGNELYRRWLLYTSLYFAVIFVVLLLMYPGHWVADEFKVLDAVKHYSLSYNWQNYFTNIFYTFCLYLFPSPISILIAQILFASFVVGYVVLNIRNHLHRKFLAYFLYVPFLLFPVLVNDLYPLRGTLYSYIELLFISKLIFRSYGNARTVDPYHEFTKYSLLIMLLIFWRSEGIYYLIVLPILFYKLGLWKRETLSSIRNIAWLALCLCIFTIGFVITKTTSSKEYAITAFVNPLSTMVQQPLHGTNIPQRLNEINQVVNIQTLKQYPSYNEIPAFWNGAVQPNYQVHIKDFEHQYAYLVLHNPKAFMHNRIKTFLSTNSFDPVASTSWGMFDLPNYSQNSTASNFLKNNHFVAPLNNHLRRDVSTVLLCFTQAGTFTFLGHILWNAIIPISLLCMIDVIMLLKKRWLWVCITTLVLLQIPIIFLTAPANYFFYYLPAYIIGYFIAACTAILYLDRRLRTTTQHRY